MGIDNRTLTLSDWPARHDPTGTNVWTCPRYTDYNTWQDRGIRGYNFDQCSQFSGWRGCLWQYGQLSVVGTGSQKFMRLYNPWTQDQASGRYLDTRNRMILVKMWYENTAGELPGGGTYDPNTFVGNPVWRIMYTGAGAPTGLPPASGDYWTPWANVYFYASDDGQKFYIGNNTGAEVNIAMSLWLFENTNDGYADKRIMTQNLYQSPPASFFNARQDYAVNQLHASGSTLVPVNTFEGGAVYYGQWTYNNAAATRVDASRNWRERILESYWQEVGNVNQLPTGANYDPDNAGTAAWNLWSTEGGTAPAAPWGTVFRWDPRANVHVYAANAAGGGLAAGDFAVYNNTGGAIYGMLWTLQSENVA